jgi:hypothetical protein
MPTTAKNCGLLKLFVFRAMELGWFETTEKGLSQFIVSPILYIPFLLTQEAFENWAVTLFGKYTAKMYRNYFGKYLAYHYVFNYFFYSQARQQKRFFEINHIFCPNFASSQKGERKISVSLNERLDFMLITR